VEHFTTKYAEGITGQHVSYEECLYRKMTSGKFVGRIKGFPMTKGNWCTKLKLNALRQIELLTTNCIQYLGIAADEPERIARHTAKSGNILPLVEIGWDEAYCHQYCEEQGILSPIYSTAIRGGCWFCHNQSVDQLRVLRKTYPDLWALLMKWDLDSPVSFHSDGHTVHDFDRRFQLEDEGFMESGDKTFRWAMIENPPLRQLSIWEVMQNGE